MTTVPFSGSVLMSHSPEPSGRLIRFLTWILCVPFTSLLTVNRVRQRPSEQGHRKFPSEQSYISFVCLFLCQCPSWNVTPAINGPQRTILSLMSQSSLKGS